jgi:uroporphyrinogen decarboxylase
MYEETMTGRERVLAALSHQESDRVPIDIGSTWNSTVTIPFYERLKKHFGIDSPTVMINRMMQVCDLDERILQELHVDTQPVYYNSPEIERNKDVIIADNMYRDQWGMTYIKPETSFYYDLYKSPLAGEISISDIMSYPWPEPNDPGFTRGLRERVKKLRSETDCALVLNLSLWILQCSQGVRGYEDWFVDLIREPKLIECMIDNMTESMLGPIELVTDEVGDLIDVVTVSDDIGHQDRLCMSPKTYRSIFKPRHAKMMDAIKSRTDAPIVWHSCGSVFTVLDDLIEIGIDGLNPVQTTAKNMEPERLKGIYGDKLVFWGGIDTMHVLNQGTKEDVYGEVKYKINSLASGGGYILNPVHNVQPDVPIENLLAMVDAVMQYGWFPVQQS